MKLLSLVTVAVATSIFILFSSLAPVGTPRSDFARAGGLDAAVGTASANAAAGVRLADAAGTFDVTAIWKEYAFSGTKAGTAGKRDLWLFWYTGSSVSTYWMFNDISAAIVALEGQYGVLVDGSPTGTLLAGGYPFYGYPHLTEASCFLYGHF